MKKLNNRGWSVSLMIMLCCILFMFLLVIGVVAYNMGIRNKEKTPAEIIEENARHH